MLLLLSRPLMLFPSLEECEEVVWGKMWEEWGDKKNIKTEHIGMKFEFESFECFIGNVFFGDLIRHFFITLSDNMQHCNFQLFPATPQRTVSWGESTLQSVSPHSSRNCPCNIVRGTQQCFLGWRTTLLQGGCTSPNIWQQESREWGFHSEYL